MPTFPIVTQERSREPRINTVFASEREMNSLSTGSVFAPSTSSHSVYIYTKISDPEIRAQLITMCIEYYNTTSDETGGRLISATGSKYR